MVVVVAAANSIFVFILVVVLAHLQFVLLEGYSMLKRQKNEFGKLRMVVRKRENSIESTNHKSSSSFKW